MYSSLRANKRLQGGEGGRAKRERGLGSKRVKKDRRVPAIIGRHERESELAQFLYPVPRPELYTVLEADPPCLSFWSQYRRLERRIHPSFISLRRRPSIGPKDSTLFSGLHLFGEGEYIAEYGVRDQSVDPLLDYYYCIYNYTAAARAVLGGQFIKETRKERKREIRRLKRS